MQGAVRYYDRPRGGHCKAAERAKPGDLRRAVGGRPRCVVPKGTPRERRHDAHWRDRSHVVYFRNVEIPVGVEAEPGRAVQVRGDAEAVPPAGERRSRQCRCRAVRGYGANVVQLSDVEGVGIRVPCDSPRRIEQSRTPNAISVALDQITPGYGRHNTRIQQGDCAHRVALAVRDGNARIVRRDCDSVRIVKLCRGAWSVVSARRV